MPPLARSTLCLVVLAAAASCKRTPRVDTRAVTPLVAPGTGTPADAGARPPTKTASRSRRPVRYVADRPAPDGALGVRWGMTRAEVLGRNQAAGVECRESREYTFCRRALVEVPVPVVVTYEFCGEGLCAVAVDGQSTRDEARMASDYDRLLATVRATLGEPSDASREVAPGCAGHLALCLASKQSELSARWAWQNGPHVQLSVDQDEADAFQAVASVTWLSAERARRAEAADEAPAGAALADGGAPGTPAR